MFGRRWREDVGLLLAVLQTLLAALGLAATLYAVSLAGGSEVAECTPGVSVEHVGPCIAEPSETQAPTAAAEDGLAG